MNTRLPNERGIRGDPLLVLSWPDLGWLPSLQEWLRFTS
jgi:hypothetical protein